MAGNYFYDPRPFYGLDHHGLMPMDEVFYGRRDPWYMYQMPYGQYEDPHRSRSVDHRRPDQHYIQSHDQYREYRRPDFRDDTYTNFQQEMQGHSGKGNQKGGNNNNNNNNHHGGNNHGGNNRGGNNHGGNGHGGNNHGGNQKKQKQDSDDESDDYGGNNHHKGGNKNKGGGHNNSHNHSNKGGSGHGHNNQMSAKGWSDNRGFKHHHHRRSLSLTQTLLKKLGLRDDTSSDSSDDERYMGKKNKGGQGGSNSKPYTVRFDDQSYGHGNGGHGSNQKHKGVHDLGEDHGSHAKKGGGGGHGGHGGQPQGILKKNKGNHNDDSSDDDNRGPKNKGGNNQHHGGSESGKKGGGGGHGGGGQSHGKQLGRSQSMDFRVNLCCENCERKVRKSLKYMDDVDHVHTDQLNNRVVVVGNAKPESVLKKLRKVKKDTLIWQHHK